jgi:hypothetical protein
MKKVIKLTEADLARIIKRVISEEMEDMTSNNQYTDKIEDCTQQMFGPGILPKIPSCVWLAKYHLSKNKSKFDKNDKYDKVKVPACRSELEKLESDGEYGAVYTGAEFMNCVFDCTNCFGKGDIANF